MNSKYFVLLSVDFIFSVSLIRSRSLSGTSHIDWFAKDLLSDSFHDALCSIFDDNYEDVYISQQLKQTNHGLHRYVDQFIDQVMKEAFDILGKSSHQDHVDVSC